MIDISRATAAWRHELILASHSLERALRDRQSAHVSRRQRGVLRLQTQKQGDDLSDPRNRNHKSLAIANHNFEVASFSRRNRNEIAVLQGVSESQ